MEEKTKSSKGPGAPEGNQNAVKWTFEEAEKLMLQAVELSKDKKYDFIGEVAKDLDTNRHKLKALYEKFPELKEHFNAIKANCETNCYANGKNGKINTAMAIVNLKSNHGWTDRVDNTTKGDKVPPSNTTVINYNELSDEALEEIAKKSAAWKD